MKKHPVLVLVCTMILFTHYGFVQDLTEKRIYVTQRVNPKPPAIDGRLEDPCWSQVEWATDFIQILPNEGETPIQETAFKILYDDANLYVAIRLYDSHPDSIELRIARRDNPGGDNVSINIDSYFDKRTAFAFDVNAAGVKWDAVYSDDGQSQDTNWDPVWYAKTRVDSLGWNAELQIPFTQLRFGKKEEHIWGIQVQRYYFRQDEASVWQFIPQTASGWINRFGELHGIHDITPRPQIELLPYARERYQRFQKQPLNPYAKGSDLDITVGLDAKLGITHDMTLDLTINPDFGQVEADPSVINLTAFETFYQEKRPFFIEGRNIFDFQITNFGTSGMDNLFYSRRIGRPPHRYPSIGYGEYLDYPEQTSILGAFKLTGKNKHGLSVGIMESVTAEECAEIDSMGKRRNEVVEPLTNYFAGRLQKDFSKGNTILGGMITAVNRQLNNPSLQFLHRDAYTGGLDFVHYWKDKTYYMFARTVFSHVRGEPEAILRTQTASPRFLQRPDADHITLDSTRTSLSGHGGSIEIGRRGNSRFTINASFAWRSPGLTLDDMGFQMVADYAVARIQSGYNIFQPFAIFRRMNVEGAVWNNFIFSGESVGRGGYMGIRMQLINYWNIMLNAQYEGEYINITNLRGGPAIKLSPYYNSFFGVTTDGRKKLRFDIFMMHFAYANDEINATGFNVGVTYRPNNALNLSILPNINFNKQRLQYVGTRNFGLDDRYIMADIDQKTVGLTFRLNYSITPELSIQYYGQPFVASGKYSVFKRITDPRAEAFEDRFHVFSEDEIQLDETSGLYSVDDDSDGQPDYDFWNPDFNFREFRSNLVVRWEYLPGSTIYFVWSQQRTGFDPTGDFHYTNNMDALFSVPPHNVFLVKLNYWLSL